MGLGSLCDDLLLKILNLLAEEATEPYCGYQGERPPNYLLSILYCSRRLYRLGEPILYRKIVQTTPRTLLKVLKTVLAHPSLTEHVRAANLTDCGPSRPEDLERRFQENTIRTPFDNNELQLIDTRLGSLQCPDRAAWLNCIREGYWGAMSTFLLALLPNLQVLNIEQCQEERWQNLWNRNVFSYTLSEQKLRNLRISYRKRASTSDKGLRAIPSRVLASPNLQSFSGDMIYETSWTPPSSDTKLFLKSLYLDRSNFSLEAFKNLINSCPHLEILKYEHDEVHNGSGGIDEHPMQPALVDNALCNLKSTLKELILYRTAQDAPPSPTMAEFGIIKSLPFFPKLTSLSITASLLLGPQMIENSTWYSSTLRLSAPSQALDSCLPFCLENLELKNCGENIYDQVKALMEVKQVRTPKLKSLTIEFVHIPRRDGEYNPKDSPVLEGKVRAKDLDEMCTKKGVCFNVWYN